MRLNKALHIALAVALLLMLCCAPAMAKTVAPGKDFYYLDNANVLSEALEGEIFFSNKLLYDACGAQIVVVTVDTTGREAIDDYAYDLFNSWGIGDAAKDNGFLLLLAIGDEDYYARTGSGIDRNFSASTIKQFYDEYLEADFAAQNYEAGVKKFFEAVFKRIADTYSADVTTAQGVAAYREYVAQNEAAQDYGGYNGTRRVDAREGGLRRDHIRGAARRADRAAEQGTPGASARGRHASASASAQDRRRGGLSADPHRVPRFGLPVIAHAQFRLVRRLLFRLQPILLVLPLVLRRRLVLPLLLRRLQQPVLRLWRRRRRWRQDIWRRRRTRQALSWV